MNGQDREERLDGLIGQYLEQSRLGEAPGVEAFAASHPECREELLELLPGVVSMESLRGAVQAEAATVAQQPEHLGEYRILGEIGRGGMGVVYEAIQDSLGKPVAIKALSPAWAGEEALCRRFEEEARTVAKLRHTHIVEVYGAGRDGDSRYFVMELVDGVGLDRVVGGTGKDPEAAAVLAAAMQGTKDWNRFVAEIGRQAAAALAYAHSQQVLHRDVKPSNLLLDRQGGIHVSDFGLATALDQEGLERAVSHPQAGTLRYLAPERLDGPATPRSDQYSLGLALYELLAGRPAFPETSPGELVKRIAEGRVAPLAKAGGTDPDLALVVGKCLARDPDDRYPSLEEAAEDFGRYLQELPVRAKPASPLRRLQLWRRRHPLAALFSGVAAALFLVFNLALLLSYAEARRALKQEAQQRQLAEENARIAVGTLDRVFGFHGSTHSNVAGFTRIAPGNARLLEDLQPFYERISRQGGEAGDHSREIADTNFVLGIIYVRTGRLEQAVAAFERARDQYAGLGPKYAGEAAERGARCRNELAAALLHSGHEEKAAQAWRQVADDFRTSPQPACRFEAVRALMSLVVRRPRLPGIGPGALLDDDQTSRTTDDAMALLLPLLKENPDNPDYRFALGTLVSSYPRLERQAGPLAEGGVRTLFAKLVEEYPDHPRYRLELVRHLAKINLRNIVTEADIASLEEAVRQGTILLSSSDAVPEAIVAVADVEHKLIGALTLAGRTDDALREASRAVGIFSVLANSPDAAPEWRLRLMLLETREADIWLQLDNTPMATRILRDLEEQGKRLEPSRKELPDEDYAEIHNRIDRLERRLPPSQPGPAGRL